MNNVVFNMASDPIETKVHVLKQAENLVIAERGNDIITTTTIMTVVWF